MSVHNEDLELEESEGQSEDLSAESANASIKSISDPNQDPNPAPNQEKTPEGILHVPESTTTTEPYTVYSNGERFYISALAASVSMFSTISQPIYYPVIPVLEAQFNVSVELVNLTITMYALFQGLAPSVFAPFADARGRRPVYLICLGLFISANIGLALSTSYWMLFGFRIMQATGIASTVAVGYGVVGDLTTRADRGAIMGMTSAMALVGNAFGPLIGGVIAQSLGWRAIFWFLCIAGSVSFVLISVGMPETNRSLVLNGRVIPSKLFNKSPYALLRKRILGVPNVRAQDLAEPLVRRKVEYTGSLQLLRHLDVIMILVPPALHYAAWMMILAALSTLLSENYGFSTSQVGYTYLASGAGSVGGSLLGGRLLNKYYRQRREKYKQMLEETGQVEDDVRFNIQSARLTPGYVYGGMFAASTLVFGWTLARHVHYIVPVLSTFVSSFACTAYMNTSQTLMIDLFPDNATSATAAMNMVRCVLGAVGLAVLDRMIRTLNPGGCFTVMIGITLASMVLTHLEIQTGVRYEDRRAKRKALEGRSNR